MRLSLVLPTYNEAQNVPELLRRVSQAANPSEIILVDDDSPDQTWKVAESLKAEYPALRVLRRIGKKGLSSAVVDGCDLATGEVIVVMDSDLQHDPAIITALAQKIEEGAGVAVASRYREGGSVGEWVHGRRILSKFGTFVAQKLPNVETSDPMSGFFAVKTDLYKTVRSRLVPEGFKILFELLAAVPRSTTLAEVPLKFQPRLHGESKLSLLVQLQFLKQALRIGLRKIGLSGARIFAVIIVVLAGLFLSRAWALRYLYTDASLRRAATTQLQDIAQSRGWPISDLVIENVERDGTMRLTHHSHIRGEDPQECWMLPSTGELTPCAK